MKILAKKCDGSCREKNDHSHHLTALGKFYYVYRFNLLNNVFEDPRPQAPAGGVWFQEYAQDWLKHFSHNTEVRSCWVRDINAFWVWCTDTPGFDRDWFDDHGWQFPSRWITFSSKDFYVVGHDDLSTIVSIDATEDVTE